MGAGRVHIARGDVRDISATLVTYVHVRSYIYITAHVWSMVERVYLSIVMRHGEQRAYCEFRCGCRLQNMHQCLESVTVHLTRDVSNRAYLDNSHDS